MLIEFERYDQLFTGILIKELENSVIVAVDVKDMESLRIPNDRVVISKKRITKRGEI